MIRPLRRRHRWMILIVATLTGLLIVAGLLTRRPVPKMDVLPLGAPVAERGGEGDVR